MSYYKLQLNICNIIPDKKWVEVKQNRIRGKEEVSIRSVFIEVIWSPFI